MHQIQTFIITYILIFPQFTFAQKVFEVEYESQAENKIFFVKYESQADLKIYFVPYESQAGWSNLQKQYLLKFKSSS